MSGGFVRPHPEGVELRLDSTIVGFLLQFPAGLDAIERGSDDPAARRLNIPVYLDDQDADREWWGLMGGELDEGRAADRAAFARAIGDSTDGVVVDRDTAHAMLRVLVESRLALAARLGVDVEEDYENLDTADAGALQLLAELQMGVMAALGP